METDLSFQNMLWFGKQAFLGNSSGAKHGHGTGEFCDHAQYKGVCGMEPGVQQAARPGLLSGYVAPNAQASCWSMVNNELSPFVEPSTMSGPGHHVRQ